MTSIKKDFFGKEVADAIKQACDVLGVPQEQLEIEVVETGSTGIFGLIRKKAHITAFIKEKVSSKTVPEKEVADKPAPKKAQPEEVVEQSPQPIEKSDNDAPAVTEEEKALPPEETEAIGKTAESTSVIPDNDEEEDEEEDSNINEVIELPEESLKLIHDELLQLLELMGYPSPVEVTVNGNAVFCQVGDEFELPLTGQDGKTLDSIQYLIRKIVARKVPHRLRLTVDVGNYREKRLLELKERAIELAEKVKENGKTQVIPALSPSERRVIHMSLQEDKEIRSRSVGDGLFKKILIYKPGKTGNKSGNKGRGGGRKRGPSRGRKNTSSRKKSE